MSAPDTGFCDRDKKNYGEDSSVFLLTRSLGFLASVTLGLPIALAGGVYTALSTKSEDAKHKAVVDNYKFDPIVKSLVDLKPFENREFDLVMYGATGFAGRLACLYMARQYGTSIKWAIAGRRVDALEKIRAEVAEINPELKNLTIIQVDSANEKQLHEMCASARCVITTVGPYAKYGTPLVRACISTKSNLCDITGEVDWHSGLIEHYDAEARAAGSRVVSFCGHDCIPWELSTFMLAKKLKSKGEGLRSIEFADALKGEASGGTIATMLHAISTGPYRSKKMTFSPLLMTEQGTKSTYQLKNNMKLLPTFTSANAWGGPFVMALANIKVVQRSNALNGYGANISYSESRIGKSLSDIIGRYLEMGIIGTVMILPPALRSMLLPDPGQGPSEATMDKSFLEVAAFAVGEKGTKVGSRMYFKTDPGYRDTARMLVETGLAIALTPEKCQRVGGVLTPGTCCADALFDRLLATGTEYSLIE